MTATRRLEDYREVTRPGLLDLIWRLSERVQKKSILHVNSTRYGGGVAEILHWMVPLLNEVGVQARWEVIAGDEKFFRTTKAFHNALQGQEENVARDLLDHYREVNARNAKAIADGADLIVIHDPQPAALIERRERQRPERWIWRCHIDLSRPYWKIWSFLRQFVVQYDAAIFSLPKFAQRLPIPQYQIWPSIDPLSDKNRELNQQEIDRLLGELNVPRDKPILLQVSRFDRFKDPVGVIQVYRLVKKRTDCRLVLAGGDAVDDPEGAQVLAEVEKASEGDADIHTLLLPPTAHLQINALQRAATIVLQKSTKEGFGLTVAEAMWKAKPVIGGAVGGITAQLTDGVTGYTVNSIEGAAYRALTLLADPQLRRQMGESAKEYVRQHFLIARHLRDYLVLMGILLGTANEPRA